MKKATFPLRFGPSLERLRNPFERATFVITNFPLFCLLLLLNLLKEVSFDEEEGTEGTEEERNTSPNFRIISLYSPTYERRRRKSFPTKKTLSKYREMRETDERRERGNKTPPRLSLLSLDFSSSSSSSSRMEYLLL
jgi:hypothetical protein